MVDDHLINREFLQAGLGRFAGRLTSAASGAEAVALAAREHYDVIVLDLHMPRMDGLATAERIRELDSSTASARLIILTADTRDEERRRLLGAGIDAYLNKPITIEALVRAIEAICRSGQAGAGGDSGRDSPGSLIDNDRALAAANQDQALASRLQQMLADELSARLPELDRLLADRQHEAAAALLHQWAGAGGYAGASLLVRSCRDLRQCLLEGPSATVGAEYLQLLRMAHASQAALRVTPVSPAISKPSQHR